MSENIIVSGASGFISFHLINFLLENKYKVYGIDKKVTKSIIELKKNKNFIFQKIDLSKENSINKFIVKNLSKKFSSYWHLAANSDISKGVNDYKIELRDTFLTTINSVTICKKLIIKKIIFSSSSAIFGNLNNKIHENSSPLRPISNYGAMKLASESYIYSSNLYFNKIIILRFPNVVGSHMTHGLIFDLFKKIKINNKNLYILGDGNQKKPYIHSSFLVKILIKLYNKKLKEKINVFNIGPSDTGIKVKSIVGYFIKTLNLKDIKVYYQQNKEGWVGDVVKYSYDNTLISKTLKIRIPSSKESIIKTLSDNKL